VRVINDGLGECGSEGVSSSDVEEVRLSLRAGMDRYDAAEMSDGAREEGGRWADGVGRLSTSGRVSTSIGSEFAAGAINIDFLIEPSPMFRGGSAEVWAGKLHTSNKTPTLPDPTGFPAKK